jgi:TATA-binding protein-associated factor Taf7
MEEQIVLRLLPDHLAERVKSAIANNDLNPDAIEIKPNIDPDRIIFLKGEKLC